MLVRAKFEVREFGADMESVPSRHSGDRALGHGQVFFCLILMALAPSPRIHYDRS